MKSKVNKDPNKAAKSVLSQVIAITEKETDKSKGKTTVKRAKKKL
jgi:hypothetical protein